VLDRRTALSQQQVKITSLNAYLLGLCHLAQQHGQC